MLHLTCSPAGAEDDPARADTHQYAALELLTYATTACAVAGRIISKARASSLPAAFAWHALFLLYARAGLFTVVAALEAVLAPPVSGSTPLEYLATVESAALHLSSVLPGSFSLSLAVVIAVWRLRAVGQLSVLNDHLAYTYRDCIPTFHGLVNLLGVLPIANERINRAPVKTAPSADPVAAAASTDRPHLKHRSPHNKSSTASLLTPSAPRHPQHTT